ncbi:alkaline phosphatase D family protein [Pontibacter sp. G13]|uniref:alkaline phosphatase D family protein n=1 Tax=Pontibacter sp. G13 TaxID=3074898 RepID=UPI002889C9A7|nr:alkaline phosphatase D family protein [Pontibacter sp. G13]WNJ17745.1 alkaline phosphatase D family protein [Pontibacter sp. G13]
MKKLILSVCLVAMTLGVSAQQVQQLDRTESRAADVAAAFNPNLAPFYHGVASGDPLADRVIIWTRYTPDMEGTYDISYTVATDTGLTDVVTTGQVSTFASKDYTVKVDVTGLTAGTTYYFQFEDTDGRKSIIGRTRTAASGAVDQLRFAVVSCSNYDEGYFNAYGNIAQRNDLDAVLHLGDYIYEYGENYYGDSANTDRVLEPAVEILNIVDYRTRYSLYKLDENLIKLHQQHPMVAIWDDHESANDAFKDGAENHDDATEGTWDARKKTARQVYFEWMPIREKADSTIYRALSYGDLVDLIMLDTRLEGREEQINDITNPLLYAPNRTLLGATQKQWLKDQLANSTAKWKVVGNQVIFSEFNVGWAGPATGQTFEQVESGFLDIWDGYPAERDTLINFISSNSIDNVIWLTGDFHSTFAFDIALRPSVFAVDVQDGTLLPTYDPATGNGSVAVEFATPSITSKNFDENVGAAASAGFEFQMNNPILTVDPTDPVYGITPNPHMKYVDLDQHGYFVLDLKEDSAQADWYFVQDIRSLTEVENHGKGAVTMDGGNRLKISDAEATPKAIQEIPAPWPNFTTSIEEASPIHLFEAYPVPAHDFVNVSFATTAAGDLRVELMSLDGSMIQSISEQVAQGLFQTQLNTSELASGFYLVRISLNGATAVTRKVIID